MTTTTAPTNRIHIGDVIEFQPRQGKTRIVKVTALHSHGFDAVFVGSKQRTFGFFTQIVRVHRPVDTSEIEHRTETVGQGEGFCAWKCSCGESGVGLGSTEQMAFQDAKTQRRYHLVDAGEDVDTADVEDVA